MSHYEIQPTTPTMPAGWYPSEANPAELHYWNGAAWMDGRTRPTSVQVVPSAVTVIAWIVAIVSLGYMLPWAVACSRDMPNHGAVALVNLLLGWTGVGWVIALVMACVQRKV